MAHGIKTTESNTGSFPVPVLANFPIFLIGTSAAATDLDEGESKLVRTPTDVTNLGLSGVGTLATALEDIFSVGNCTVVVHRVAAGADDAASAVAIAGAAVSRTGLWAALLADAAFGHKPKIICAPKFSSVAGVYAQMILVANRLLGIAVMDGPNDDEAAAIAMAGALSDADGRGYIVDPYVITSDERPASALAAAMWAGVEYWQSASNRVIPGVTGTARVIGFEWGEDDTEATALNTGKVATVIRSDGWRLWGVRGTGTNPQTLQLNQRRVADVINESIKAAHRWAVDQNITKNFVGAVVDSVNAFLRKERARGAIAGGKCWPNADLNTAESLSAGQLWIDYDFTPTPVAEDIRFQQRVTNTYLSNLLA